MDWRFRALAAAIALSAQCTPGLIAPEFLHAQEAPEAQQAQAGQAAQADERDNDQVVVIGAGFGGHAFSRTHHAESESSELDVKSALMSQYYAEWYVFDEVGVGLRFITFGTTASALTTVTLGGTTETVKDEIELNVDNWQLTVNWVPLGGSSYARLGVLAGLGISDYELAETRTPGGSDTNSTSGTAALLGVYVDWGADGFGARLGTQYLATDLGDIDGSSVDASGRDIYLDLRWAF